MTNCSTCQSTILFGGVRDGERRFCSERCREASAITDAARSIPDALLREQVWKFHQSACPRCHGAGPVDAHRSHWVWSMLVFTRWGTRITIGCRACGRKQQLKDLLSSAVFGWWGVPWGLLITPAQVIRDVMALFGGPNPEVASPLLERLVLTMLVTHESPERQVSRPLR